MKYYKTPENEIYAYYADGSQDHLIDSSFIQITEEERLDIIQTNLSYSDKRALKYPSIGEQLDMIYHKGIDDWKTEIKKIKDSYPKS
jgi:hypothetical protein